jgi:hypothetical protein
VGPDFTARIRLMRTLGLRFFVAIGKSLSVPENIIF